MGLGKLINEVRNVFGTSGELKTEPVRIVFKEGVQPYSVHATRRVPLLMSKVRDELNRMEEGIERCTTMVPVLKPTGNICISFILRD